MKSLHKDHSFVMCMLIAVFNISLTTSTYSQQELYSTFSSVEYTDFLKSEIMGSEALRNKEKEIEQFYSNKILIEDPNQKIIPVVFHVIQSSKKPKINGATIESQLDAINRDFELRRIIQDHENDYTGKFKRTASACQIRFCIANSNPDGKETSGVNFINSSVEIFNDFISMKDDTYGAAPWNTEEYLNIWICDLGENNKGFAQFPSGPKELDGIVIDRDYVGVLSEGMGFDNGSTLTHLIGNYLGLLPLWGLKECADDYINDTPIHNGPNYLKPKSNHVSTCDGYPSEMTMNFMDNTNDDVKYMFTKGQMLRMQATLSAKGPRNLLNSNLALCVDEKSIANNIATLRELETKSDVNFDISIEPNPAFNEVRIQTSAIQKKSDLTILNSLGQLVFTAEEIKSINIDVSDWPRGNYFFHFNNSNSKIVKQISVQ